MSRLIRSLTLAVAAAALVLPAALAATAASAATGPVTATKEQAGYQFTGAQFRYAQATVYLRNASQYSGSIGALGQSVQFWGGGRVYVLGVSDTTTTSPYSPAVAVVQQLHARPGVRDLEQYLRRHAGLVDQRCGQLPVRPFRAGVDLLQHGQW